MADIKDFSKILEREMKAIEADVKKPTNMKYLAQNLRQDIVKRSRLGFSVERNGDSKKKFKALSESYKKQRKKQLGFWTRPDGLVVPITDKKYLKQNSINLSSNTSASKSNVTRTGQMLDSLGEKVGFGKFSIEFKNAEAREKAEYVQNDRPFMYASKQELKRLELLVRGFLREAIAKIKF